MLRPPPAVLCSTPRTIKVERRRSAAPAIRSLLINGHVRPFSDTHCPGLTAAKQPLVRASRDRPNWPVLAWYQHRHPLHELQRRSRQVPGTVVPWRLQLQHGRHGGLVLPRTSRTALADTVQHQALQVDVQVGRRPQALSQGDRGAVGLAGLEPGPLDQKPGQHPVRDLQNRREQRGLRRQRQPNPDRQRQHPLACRHMRSDVVDQVGCGLRHASRTTRRPGPDPG